MNYSITLDELKKIANYTDSSGTMPFYMLAKSIYSRLESADTIDKAKKLISEKAIDGLICPCCDQFVKMYKRKFNAGMAYSLILIYKITSELKPKDGWIHVQREFASKYGYNSNGMDYIQLVRWGLIEAKKNSDTHKRDSGYYRLTDSAEDFVKGITTIAEYAYVYNNKTIRLSQNEISIKKALGERFNYSELMNGHTSDTHYQLEI